MTLEQAEWKRLKEVETDMRSTIKEEENTGCDKKKEEKKEEEEEEKRYKGTKVQRYKPDFGV